MLSIAMYALGSQKVIVATVLSKINDQLIR